MYRDSLESCISLSRELDLHHFLALNFLVMLFHFQVQADSDPLI